MVVTNRLTVRTTGRKILSGMVLSHRLKGFSGVDSLSLLYDFDIINSVSVRSYLKNRILVQGQGGAEFHPADILKYFEELKREPNAGIGPKDIFEIASI
jgi:hypothetical protein